MMCSEANAARPVVSVERQALDLVIRLVRGGLGRDWALCRQSLEAASHWMAEAEKPKGGVVGMRA